METKSNYVMVGAITLLLIVKEGLGLAGADGQRTHHRAGAPHRQGGGGDTSFNNQYLAYAELPQDLKRAIEKKVGKPEFVKKAS